ncbi:MAG: MFS transporter, partial [Acidimicrobiia bacterium]|nr:MFS transporter [Acidimicrobiia bacterium]
ARAALMPAIVGRDNLMAANSISESTRITFGVVGTAVAGVYAGVATSLAVLFVVDAATFIVSAILEMRIRTSGRPPAAAEHHLWNELKAGLAVITRTRPLVSVLVGAGVAMLGFGAVNVLIVPFVISDLGIAESWFGAFEAAQVVSMVAAGALVAALAKKVKPAVVLAVGLLGVGGVLALFGGVQAGWQLVVLMFLIGWFITPVQASAHTILQQEVAPEALGRAGAGFSTVATTANVVSMALAGTAAALVGIRGVFVVSGILGAAAGLLTYSLNRTPASANAGLRALESTSSTQG